MKNTEKNVNILNLLAFIGIVIIAVLEFFGLNFIKNIINLGDAFKNFLKTIENICVLLVFGITAYNFVRGKSKGWLITYIIAMSIIFIATILIWII